MHWKTIRPRTINTCALAAFLPQYKNPSRSLNRGFALFNAWR
ncbi:MULTISPECIES: hypothetical protein [unclassified Endozoicomonas]